MIRLRAKPLETTGLVWTGDNFDEAREFCGTYRHRWDHQEYSAFNDPLDLGPQVWNSRRETDEHLSPGDVIVRGAFGELTRLRAESLRVLYDVIGEEETPDA